MTRPSFMSMQSRKDNYFIIIRMKWHEDVVARLKFDAFKSTISYEILEECDRVNCSTFQLDFNWIAFRSIRF